MTDVTDRTDALTAFLEPALEWSEFIGPFPLVDTPEGPTIPTFLRPHLRQSGLYVFTLADGREYIGEAKNVLTRCEGSSGHRKKAEWWSQATSMAFAPMDGEDHHRKLFERLKIYRRLEQGAQLLNKVHTMESVARPGVPAIYRKDALDQLEKALLASDEESARFPFQTPAPSGAQPDTTTRKLLDNRTDAEITAVIEVFAHFLRYALRAPAHTMANHWKVHSAMEHAGPHRYYVLATLVVRDIPFVHIRENKHTGGIHVQVHLDPQPRIAETYGAEHVEWPGMLRGDKVQIVEMSPAQAIEALTGDEVFQAAARRTASRLMRSGACTTRHAHHQWLADELFAHIREAGLN
jgi:hypothetical protein